MSVQAEHDPVIPAGLHNLEYARWLLENVLAWPAVKINLELVAECLSVIGKTRHIENHEACAWLGLQIMTARERGIAVRKWWLQDGEFNNLEESKAPPMYTPIDKEALEKEQARPEWKEAAEQLRATMRKIAFPQADVANERKKLKTQLQQMEAKRCLDTKTNPSSEP